MMRRSLPLLFVAALLPAGGTSRAGDGFVHLIGAIHEHSGYSDGWPGSTPRDYYASARSLGLDFMSGGEHSDNADIPNVFSEYCLTAEDFPKCPVADDDEPVNSFRKWDATLEYARAASSESYTAFRGFEWTADVFGHINVYFSRNDENAKTDGGYGVTMETFYRWFLLPWSLGGGDDGLATFNHPGDKCSLGKTHPTCNWNQFAYVPEVDERMVGIELFNGSKAFDQYYAQALDRGWHVGAVGAEDKGHDKKDQWGGPRYAKTVVIVPDQPDCPAELIGFLTCPEDALRQAMLARHTYAVQANHNDVRIDLEAGGEMMGARIRTAPGTVAIASSVTGEHVARLEVVSNGGTVVASADGTSISYDAPVEVAERYYFLRVIGDDARPIAYSSPVWTKVGT